MSQSKCWWLSVTCTLEQGTLPHLFQLTQVWMGTAEKCHNLSADRLSAACTLGQGTLPHLFQLTQVWMGTAEKCHNLSADKLRAAWSVAAHPWYLGRSVVEVASKLMLKYWNGSPFWTNSQKPFYTHVKSKGLLAYTYGLCAVTSELLIVLCALLYHDWCFINLSNICFCLPYKHVRVCHEISIHF